MAKTNKATQGNSDVKDVFLGVLADKLTPGDIEDMLTKLRGGSSAPVAETSKPTGKVDVETKTTTKAVKNGKTAKAEKPKRLGRPRKTDIVAAAKAQTATVSVHPDYNVQRVRNLLMSVDKHVESILVTVHKIQDAGSVPEEVFDIIDTKLEKLKLSGYRANATATHYEPRTSKGGRKPKVIQEQEAA